MPRSTMPVSDTRMLQVVLGPAVGDGGYELVDVAGEEPWSSLRSEPCTRSSCVSPAGPRSSG